MDGVAVTIECRDGALLGGDWWPCRSSIAEGVVVVNCATGVLARYYHRYAAFLAKHGFHVLTYDYRGIGKSGRACLKDRCCDWRCWGERDVEAALDYALRRGQGLPLFLVGHSIGGFLPGYAESAAYIARMLTIGAQYAYWRDYRQAQRLGQVAKWHLAMPAMTALWGYFPGRRLGWLEDLPAGVAYGWSFGRRRIEGRLPPPDRQSMLARFAAVKASILALGVSDDAFATMPAMTRSLDYYVGAQSTRVMLEPADLGFDKIGHFDLFHDRHAAGFWLDTLLWLRDGINPWPARTFA